MDNDPLLAGLSPEERLNAIKQFKNQAFRKEQELKKTTVTETKARFLGLGKKKYKTTVTETKARFLGLGKKKYERALTPEESAQRQQALQELAAEKDKYQRYEVYVKRVQAADYWIDKYASQDLKDNNGNVIAEYPQYEEATVVDAQGNEHRVARVNTYNPETLQTTSRYYSLDVQKVGDPTTGQGGYYSIVPDMDNELTDVQLKKGEYTHSR